MQRWVEIDGSLGEGGGQVLRTALVLSSLTGRPLRIFNIRAGRRSPGLKPQHLVSALAAARICSGRLRGAELDSMELLFEPGPITPGRYTFDVASVKSSAGSTGLIFQTVLLPLGFAGGRSVVTIRGGTHVEWSPPADFLKYVYIPFINSMGAKATLDIERYGFYPKGGGELHSDIGPFTLPLSSFEAKERGRLKAVTIFSAVANLPLSIAQRQLKRALGVLKRLGIEPLGRTMEVPSPGPGTYVFILAEFEKSVSGFSALGAPGKRAEKVAEEAANLFEVFMSKNGAIDPHLADQAVLPAALARGKSAFTTTEITGHLLTNISVIESFLPVKFTVRGRAGEEGEVVVEGAGYRAPGPLE